MVSPRKASPTFHISELPCKYNKAEEFYDSVGVGFYYLDLHPSTGGDNYIDMPSLPFQIPLGALIPQQMNNLLPANKNIGNGIIPIFHVSIMCHQRSLSDKR